MKRENYNRPKCIVFDVNETLLNMNPIKIAINRFYSSESAFQMWFSTLLQYAMVESINPPNYYKHFGAIAKASLAMVAARFNLPMQEKDKEQILEQMGQLPAHADVKEGLIALQNKGFILLALTNGTKEVLQKQMAFAELAQHFDATYSVETMRSFKPQKATYEYVLRKHSLQPEEAIMVAAHSWDVHGAQAAGMQTAFIERPGQIQYPLMNKPTIVCEDLLELARYL